MFASGLALIVFDRNFKDYIVILDLLQLRKYFLSYLLHHLYRNLLEMCFRRLHSNPSLLVTHRH